VGERGKSPPLGLSLVERDRERYRDRLSYT